VALCDEDREYLTRLAVSDQTEDSGTDDIFAFRVRDFTSEATCDINRGS
jgi:hypothetical protein